MCLLVVYGIPFGVFTTGCNQLVATEKTLLDYAPNTSQLIVKINDLRQTKRQLRNFELIKKNKNALFLNYFSDNPILDKIPEQLPCLLCFSPLGKNDLSYLLVSKLRPNWMQSLAVDIQSIDILNYSGAPIQKVHFKQGDIVYATEQDSVLLASSSKIAIENSIRQNKKKLKINPSLQRAYRVSESQIPFNLLIDGGKIKQLCQNIFPKTNWDKLSNFGGWGAVDVSVSQQSIELNGILLDGQNTKTTILKDSNPKTSTVANIVPDIAMGFVSYNFDDFATIQRNLLRFQENQLENLPENLQELLEQVTEIAWIYLGKQLAIAIRTSDVADAKKLLKGNKKASYRGKSIYAMDPKTAFLELLQPLTPNITSQYYTILDGYLVFANQIKTLKLIIANLKNKSVYAWHTSYKAAYEKLTATSSILLAGNIEQIAKEVPSVIRDANVNSWNTFDYTGYRFATLQLIKENDYAHVHAILKKDNNLSPSQAVMQTASATLQAPLLGSPHLIKNHRNKRLDVVVQDRSNSLYLIGAKGDILWQKQLDNPILGAVHSVDRYKNGRYQLLFNTSKTVYLIDRNGKTVPPFPLHFEKQITQPISLFDYDQNKKYRIAIALDHRVKMYDIRGKVVPGFKFKNTETELVLPPKHIRIANKDYILIAEKQGKLHIVDRVGKNRVKIDTVFSLSGSPWFRYQNRFCNIDQNGKLIQIGTNAKIYTKTLKQNPPYQSVATNNSLVTLSGSTLSIGNKTITLHPGKYKSPQVFKIKKDTFIGLTDRENHKVYVFDSKGELLPNFPIYGNSHIQLGNLDKDSDLELVVQGESEGILIYQIERKAQK